MIGFFVILYFVATLVVAVYYSSRNRTITDFALAGQRMPVYITAFALFATWFGAETILGASGSFLSDGLYGLLEDPIGAVLCLLLIGFFYAIPLYRRGYVSIGDLIRERYGVVNERLFSFIMVVSYFAWIAGQLTALSYLLNTLFSIPFSWALVIVTLFVIVFTLSGGMWAISVTDFFQSIVIIGGLVAMVLYFVSEGVGWNEMVSFFPEQAFNLGERIAREGWSHFFAALFTLGLGSIPSQDVFQRLSTARCERTAMKGALLGAILYLLVAILPLLLIVAANGFAKKHHINIHPEQMLLSIVFSIDQVWIQVVFFGALFSAIVSTASAALLAPAVVFSENLLRSYFPNLSERRLLRWMRFSVVLFGIFSFLIALQGGSIFHLAALSSAFGLVALFVPMTLALFWRYGTESGAFISMLGGLVVWGIAEWVQTEFSPMLLGFLASLFSHLIVDLGIWIYRRKGKKIPVTLPYDRFGNRDFL